MKELFDNSKIVAEYSDKKDFFDPWFTISIVRSLYNLPLNIILPRSTNLMFRITTSFNSTIGFSRQNSDGGGVFEMQMFD